MATRATPSFGTSKPRAKIDPQAAATRAVGGSAAVQADPSTEAQVRVNVPRGYKLTTDDHLIHVYTPSTASMPRSHALHQYSIDNGVTLVD